MANELRPGMTGTWLVTTQGSEHYFDLDEGRYMRVPGEGRQQMSGDCEWLLIWEWGSWPQVGGIFFIWLHEQWRQSSTIVSIELVGGWVEDESHSEERELG